MDIKKVVLLFLIIFSHASWGQKISKRAQRDFAKAKQAFKAEKYNISLKLLSRHFNLNSKRAPLGALQLAAWSYEKLGRSAQAARLYKTMINKRFGPRNRQIVRNYKKNGNADNIPDVPTPLAAYYFQRGKNLYNLYQKELQLKGINTQTQSLSKQVTALMEISLEAEHEEDQAETILQGLAQERVKIEKQIYQKKLFLSLSRISWRNELILNGTDGSSTSVFSNVSGMCLGGGHKWFNATWEYNINACWAFASATSGIDTAAFRTIQDGVGVGGFMLAGGALWKPSSGDAAVGLNIPIMMVEGDYDNPPNGSYESTSEFSLGYLFEANWSFTLFQNRASIFTQFGKIFGFSSSLWQVGLKFTF